MSPDAGPAAALRRERRAWILAHHPDRGGDPAQFAAGLEHLAAQARPVVVTVRRRPSPLRRVAARLFRPSPARRVH